ncbi:MAG: hypothetical protein GVY16_06105 [Planctomycetes bacterium]|jgi:hypothetical protein|nr:hypothetical protein [Planctomycetota bacterium]
MKQRTKIVWWLLLFMTASWLMTTAIKSPVPAVVACVAAVMPFAGRTETRTGAGWLGFGLGLAGGLASLWAMMAIRSRMPPEATTEQTVERTEPALEDKAAASEGNNSAVDGTSTSFEPDKAPGAKEDRLAANGTSTSDDDETAPDEEAQPPTHRKLEASEVGLLALVTVGTTVPFGVLVALLYHSLARRRKQRLDDEWTVFRDED